MQLAKEDAKTLAMKALDLDAKIVEWETKWSEFEAERETNRKAR